MATSNINRELKASAPHCGILSQTSLFKNIDAKSNTKISISLTYSVSLTLKRQDEMTEHETFDHLIEKQTKINFPKCFVFVLAN